MLLLLLLTWIMAEGAGKKWLDTKSPLKTESGKVAGSLGVGDERKGQDDFWG